MVISAARISEFGRREAQLPKLVPKILGTDLSRDGQH